MSREQVMSLDPSGDGTDGFYLDQFGQVTGLTLDYNYPGAADSATWSLAADEHFSHRALAPGRAIAVISGGKVCWRGRMEEPARGVPWTCTAVGLGAMAADWTAIADDSHGGLALNKVVDGAIARGLPWIRRGGLPIAAGTNITSGSSTVADVLSQTGDLMGFAWTLDDDGAITMGTPPNGVQYSVLSQSNPGGRSAEGYATSVAVQWVSANTKKTVTSLTTDPQAVKQFGVIEAPLDLSQLGSMNNATQAAAGAAYMKLRNPRTFFAGQLVIAAGQLLNFGGTVMDLSTARPGHRLRVHWTDLDPFGEIDPTTPTDIMIGHTSYDSDGEQLTITPLDSSQRSINENAMVRRTAAYHAMRARQKRMAAEAKAAAARHQAYLKWYRRTHHGHNPPRKPAPKRRKK